MGYLYEAQVVAFSIRLRRHIAVGMALWGNEAVVHKRIMSVMRKQSGRRRLENSNGLKCPKRRESDYKHTSLVLFDCRPDKKATNAVGKYAVSKH